MRFSGSKPPWYVSGLAFECQQCGRCCEGPEEGYVWVNEEEIAAIASQLGLTAGQMRSRYVREVSGGLSLIEQPISNDCIFLESNGEGGRGCSIYPVRPIQCRTWPFWPSNLSDSDAWGSAQKRCMGINRGRVYSRQEIETKRDATHR